MLIVGIEGTISSHSRERQEDVKGVCRKWLKRRSAIEAVIGHAKTDGRLGRNYLHGREGDKINAILSGSGHNMRKLLKVLFFAYLFTSKDHC